MSEDGATDIVVSVAAPRWPSTFTLARKEWRAKRFSFFLSSVEEGLEGMLTMGRESGPSSVRGIPAAAEEASVASVGTLVFSLLCLFSSASVADVVSPSSSLVTTQRNSAQVAVSAQVVVVISEDGATDIVASVAAPRWPSTSTLARKEWRSKGFSFFLSSVEEGLKGMLNMGRESGPSSVREIPAAAEEAGVASVGTLVFSDE